MNILFELQTEERVSEWERKKMSYILENETQRARQIQKELPRTF